jgi:hypothetical protein
MSNVIRFVSRPVWERIRKLHPDRRKTLVGFGSGGGVVGRTKGAGGGEDAQANASGSVGGGAAG